MNRRGVALIAVVWVVAVCAGVVGLGFAGLRQHVLAATNRGILIRARWAAEACLAVWRGHWAVGRSGSDTVDLGGSVTCRVFATDPTAMVNVNTASANLVRRAALGTGIPAESIDVFAQSLAAALARAPLEYPQQLTALAGFDPRLTEVLTTVGSGAINLNSAAAPVLFALPGFTGEAVERVLERRAAGRPLVSLGDLTEDLSPVGAGALRDALPDLMRLVTFTAPQLVVTAEGWVKARGQYPRASVEALVAALPDRAAIIRRRVW
jgi:type II secretory pathway component PulK